MTESIVSNPGLEGLCPDEQEALESLGISRGDEGYACELYLIGDAPGEMAVEAYFLDGSNDEIETGRTEELTDKWVNGGMTTMEYHGECYPILFGDGDLFHVSRDVEVDYSGRAGEIAEFWYDMEEGEDISMKELMLSGARGKRSDEAFESLVERLEGRILLEVRSLEELPRVIVEFSEQQPGEYDIKAVPAIPDGASYGGQEVLNEVPSLGKVVQ